MKKDMPAETLVRLYRELRQESIEIWIDGGWGVDALLGKQTRPHEDVDFVVQEKDLTKLVGFLRDKGYDDVPRDDTRPWNFVLGDDKGQEVDIHVVNFDGNGDGIYGPPENGEAYPAYAFAGMGIVNGQKVLCMSAEYQVVNHTGYSLRERDHWDVAKLCDKFDIELPREYRESH